MTLTRTKTIYINGTSKDGDRILGNFNASLSENGQMSINETVSESTNLDTVEADFNEFRELAKNELKKFYGQDTETDVSSDKSGDKEVVATTSDNEAVKDDKSVGTSTKADDKPETAQSDEAKVSGVKDEETKQPVASEEVKQPVVSEEIKQPTSNEEVKQPVPSEEPKQPASSDEIKQSVANEETKEPVSSDEVKVSDVKDGENADESNQLRHQ